MTKQIHPGVFTAIIVVALLLVIFVYYKKTEPPPPMPMNPLGPGAIYLRQHPNAMAQSMSPAEKQMMSHGKDNTSAPPSALSSKPAGQSGGK